MGKHADLRDIRERRCPMMDLERGLVSELRAAGFASDDELDRMVVFDRCSEPGLEMVARRERLGLSAEDVAGWTVSLDGPPVQPGTVTAAV